VEVARLDADQERVLVLLRPERGEDRRRRGEELPLELQALGGLDEQVLDAVRRVAERVECAAQAQHERGRVVICHGGTVPKRPGRGESAARRGSLSRRRRSSR
jgi:hypothetical protein